MSQMSQMGHLHDGAVRRLLEMGEISVLSLAVASVNSIRPGVEDSNVSRRHS